MDSHLEGFLIWCMPGLLGALGGLASLAFRGPNSPPFTLGLFLSKIIASFFVGTVAGVFLAQDNTERNGWILLFGFFSYPVLTAAERRAVEFIDKFMPGAKP